VVELIDPVTKGWDVPKIKHIFWADEAEITLQILLRKYQQQDVLIWRGSSTGNFTVRSAYHMKKDQTERKRGVGSTSSATSNV
jgi:hypothetical protein